jgi:hypothetical protein
MISTHHMSPGLYLESTRYIDDGRGRPARTPNRLVTLLRRVRASRTVDVRLPRWVDATPTGAA